MLLCRAKSGIYARDTKLNLIDKDIVIQPLVFVVKSNNGRRFLINSFGHNNQVLVYVLPSGCERDES